MGLLQEILEYKRLEVARRKREKPMRALELMIDKQPVTLDFCDALRSRCPLAIIGEVKKASPSAGVLRPDFRPADIARQLESGGVACISVLTDQQYFGGSMSYLQIVKDAVAVPVLRKDFIVDEYQLFEARAYGADAVLLIVAALPQEQLKRLLREARELGMKALVEVRDETELARALETKARIIGINNRNLDTLEVRLEVAEALAPLVPLDRVVVAESGIRTRQDVKRMVNAGVSALLIGETIMRSEDIATAVKVLAGEYI